MNNNNSQQEITGVVVEALPNTMFRVETSEGENMICFLSGKMRLHRIRVLLGDKVSITKDPYGGKGRITKRL